MRKLVTIIAIVSVGSLYTACEGHRKSSGTTVTHAPETDTKENAKDADPDNLPRVVIKAFSAKGITDDQASGISDRFCAEVSKSKKINLMCANELASLIQHMEDRMKFAECNEEDCLSQLGKAIKAVYVIQCGISKVGETFVFSVKLMDVEAGKAKTRLSHEVPSGNVEDLLPAADELAAKLIAEF
jgi:hypothetical protein